MLGLSLIAAALVPQGPSTSVVINEFVYDDGGTDDREYVELYNASAAPVDISGWKIVNRDPGSPFYNPANTGTDPTYTIPAGTILQPGAFFVLGSGVVPNVNFVVGTTNLLENDNECIELQDPTGTIIDSVAYELGRGAFGPHPLEGDGFYGDLAVADNPTGTRTSIGRNFDGIDTNNNGRDFTCVQVPTPGASNVQPGTLPYIDNFDAGTVGIALSNFSFGFVAPKYVDPTIIDSNNYTSKPPSPQGGLAIAFQDNSGGGNGQQLIGPVVADVVFECYAYFEPAMAPIHNGVPSGGCGVIPGGTYELSAGEYWAIGVRGSAASNGNPSNAAGDYFTTIAPGVGTIYHYQSGIAWVHYRTVNYSRVYLVDLNNGNAPGAPTDFTVIGGPINIVQGVNDGWQRLRIHAQGNKVVGNFGGIYGADNGTRFSATGVYNNPGAIWMAYREAMCNNPMMRPPLLDAFDIHVPTTSLSTFGTPSPTNFGTPTIDTDGFALLGSTGFAITATGMNPGGTPTSAFCGLVLGFVPVPTGFPIAGAPATATGYVLAQASSIGFADPTGKVAFPLTIPGNPGLLGLGITSQIVDFDPTLPVAVPIGTSSGLTAVIGN